MKQKRRTSKIWKISKQELEDIINQSSTQIQILTKLGLPIFAGNHRTLKLRITEDNIDMTAFKTRQLESVRNNIRKILSNDHRRDWSTTFVENSSADGSTIKKYIIRNNILPYICSNCNNTGTHNDLPLSLQLEHKNGIRNDNRLENLCFLCPNCHSQTSTYSGKKNKNRKMEQET